MTISSGLPKLLVTAGPTHEPIDAVRFLGNRSSGRLGIALAAEAVKRGWPVTLLLGPSELQPPEHSRLDLHRFRTSQELSELLEQLWPAHDGLIMAAAVSDFRPASRADGKIERGDAGLALHLEPTPDLVAAAVTRRRPGQRVVGFALEEPGRLAERAREKLARKGLDAIVANPLATMDAPRITATVVFADGESTPAPPDLEKAAFAVWLLDLLGREFDWIADAK